MRCLYHRGLDILLILMAKYAGMSKMSKMNGEMSDVLCNCG